MFGKNVVCVMLMLVLVVISFCLVWWMLGCCFSSFDGRFGGMLVMIFFDDIMVGVGRLVGSGVFISSIRVLVV